jgi:hypothetical protein
MTSAVRTVVLASMLAASVALAQERGRTDGPEGSEIGKGGYTSAEGGNPGAFAFTLDGGGAFLTKGAQISPPLFAGVTLSYWNYDFYRIDLSGFYIPADNAKLWGVLLGPSFHTTTYPVAFSIGFQAGLHIPNSGSVKFVFSPRIGMDFITQSHFQLGVNANYDMDFANFDLSVIRVYLSVGYRF